MRQQVQYNGTVMLTKKLRMHQSKYLIDLITSENVIADWIEKSPKVAWVPLYVLQRWTILLWPWSLQFGDLDYSVVYTANKSKMLFSGEN
jgi:hypothetical protein